MKDRVRVWLILLLLGLPSMVYASEVDHIMDTWFMIIGGAIKAIFYFIVAIGVVYLLVKNNKQSQ
jgi:ACR3 family arsenite efflux pump ArsB